MRRRLTNALTDFRETAGPAGTLLVVTVLMLLLTTVARAVAAPVVIPGATWIEVVAETPEEVAPGERFDVAVRIDAPQALSAQTLSARSLSAYLPGLDLQRVPLTYDAQRALHVAQITLPWFAPVRGECTVRIVDGAGLELDVRVGLRAPSQS
ncbi:MAG: hypothetical protein ACI9U2_000207 [Bradymonadia bacterium]|jgi:hypothetical protein